MQKASSVISSLQHIYIPHHPVICESSLTTRLRVVFNASTQTTNGTSLNNHLLTGPKLQTDIAAVILRWRQFRYVYSADIAKMYRQILVDPRDRDYQRILWIDEKNVRKIINCLRSRTELHPLRFWRCACFGNLLSTKVMRFRSLFRLQDNIYVDDVLFGADDIPLLRQTRDQVCALLSRGKFKLRKWSSNSPKLLSDIAAENHNLACSKLLQTDEHLKILGIS